MKRVVRKSLQCWHAFAASISARRRSALSAASNRGSVILIVLITIMFAAVALTLFIEKASTDLLVDAREADAVRLRMEAYSALETTLGVLEDFRLVIGALHNPAEGWGDPLRFANYVPASGRTIEVQFEDESAKISLPQVKDSTMIEVFKSWGLNQQDAQKLTDALMGWMKKEHVSSGAGSPRPEDYDRGELPFAPPDRSLRSFSELASIDYARTVFFDEAGEPINVSCRPFRSILISRAISTARIRRSSLA
jgi:type II secretory pathway component PulK